MIATIKKLFIGGPNEKTIEAKIPPPYWCETYPQYYKMLHHEFASDQIRFQKDILHQINATFNFINSLEIDAPQKEKINELCIANAAFSARAANGVYFSRKRKEEENWEHERWRIIEHEWQYAVFYTALLINLYKQSPNEKNIDLHALSINITDDDLVFAINNAIRDKDNDTMPYQFYPLVKRMRAKTSDFLNKTD